LLWLALVALLAGCGLIPPGHDAAVAPPAAATAQAPSNATGLGDLAAISGIDALDEGQLVPTILGFALYENGGHIKGQIRGTLTNASGHVITGGDLRFAVEVDFDDGCPGRIEGAKGLGSLRVSESNPWRPGDVIEFTIGSDDHLASITGEFTASQVTWTLSAYVEDPLCWRARGSLQELRGSWRAATVGSPATGPATTGRRVQLTSAADGGSRVETVEEGVLLAVLAVKGKKVRVRTPGGVEGWTSADHIDLSMGRLDFP
jgi:hypothetical protein